MIIKKQVIAVFIWLLVSSQVCSMKKLYKSAKEIVNDKIYSYVYDDAIYNLFTYLTELAIINKDYKEFKRDFMALGQIERDFLFTKYSPYNIYFYKQSILFKIIDFQKFITLSQTEKKLLAEKYLKTMTIKECKNMFHFVNAQTPEDIYVWYHMPKQELLNFIKKEIINKQGVKGSKFEVEVEEPKKETIAQQIEKTKVPSAYSEEID